MFQDLRESTFQSVDLENIFRGVDVDSAWWPSAWWPSGFFSSALASGSSFTFTYAIALVLDFAALPFAFGDLLHCGIAFFSCDQRHGFSQCVLVAVDERMATVLL